MVVIRLSRTGAKKRPFYHMVVKTKRSRRDGGCIERVGYFNPIAQGGEVRLKLDLERIEYWASVGAQNSDRADLLIKEFKKHGERTGTQYNESKPKKVKKVTATAQSTESAESSAAE
jgi:small subunit ribosomal protein S16